MSTEHKCALINSYSFMAQTLEF